MNIHANKAIKNSIILSYCVCIFSLGSCQGNPSSLNGYQPYKSTPSPFAQPAITTNPNIMATKLTDIAKSSTDIEFKVKTDNAVCNTINTPFEMVLSFTNLTTKPLRIADQFVFAKNRFGHGGNITAFITLNGQDIYSVWDNSVADFPYPIVDAYSEIPPSGTFNKTVKYSFPKELLEGWPSLQEVVVAPTPGKYFIKFVYVQVEQSIGSWHGVVESNQVELCVRD